jgi:hypothetical protein
VELLQGWEPDREVEQEPEGLQQEERPGHAPPTLLPLSPLDAQGSVLAGQAAEDQRAGSPEQEIEDDEVLDWTPPPKAASAAVVAEQEDVCSQPEQTAIGKGFVSENQTGATTAGTSRKQVSFADLLGGQEGSLSATAIAEALTRTMRSEGTTTASDLVEAILRVWEGETPSVVAAALPGTGTTHVAGAEYKEDITWSSALPGSGTPVVSATVAEGKSEGERGSAAGAALAPPMPARLPPLVEV